MQKCTYYLLVLKAHEKTKVELPLDVVCMAFCTGRCRSKPISLYTRSEIRHTLAMKVRVELNPRPQRTNSGNYCIISYCLNGICCNDPLLAQEIIS